MRFFKITELSSFLIFLFSLDLLLILSNNKFSSTTISITFPILILKNRIKVYKKDTMPVIEHYKNLNKLNRIDGMQSIGKVFQGILKIL